MGDGMQHAAAACLLAWRTFFTPKTMAKATLNPGLQSLRGTTGGWVYRNVGGQTVVAARPITVERKPSAPQAASRERFIAAGRYAKQVLAEPWQRRMYERLAAERGRRADKLLASDYLTPPVVEEIDLSGYHRQAGGLIRVLATDDLAVASVEVVIRTAGQDLVEQGAATPIHGVWHYTTSADARTLGPLTIRAVAKDRPGHDGARELAYP